MLWYQQRRIVFWVTAHSHVLVDPALLPNTVMWRVNSSSTSFLHFPLLQHNTHTHTIYRYCKTEMAASRAQGSVFLIVGLQKWKNRGRAEASSCLREARKRGACRFIESQIRGPCARFEDADTWMFSMVQTRHVLLQYFDFLTSHKKDECIRKVMS